MTFEKQRKDSPFPWLLADLPTDPEEFQVFAAKLDGLAERLAKLSKLQIWAASTAVQVFYGQIDRRDNGLYVAGMLMGALSKALGTDEALPVCTPIGQFLNATTAHKRN